MQISHIKQNDEADEINCFRINTELLDYWHTVHLYYENIYPYLISLKENGSGERRLK